VQDRIASVEDSSGGGYGLGAVGIELSHCKDVSADCTQSSLAFLLHHGGHLIAIARLVKTEPLKGRDLPGGAFLGNCRRARAQSITGAVLSKAGGAGRYEKQPYVCLLFIAGAVWLAEVGTQYESSIRNPEIEMRQLTSDECLHILRAA